MNSTETFLTLLYLLCYAELRAEMLSVDPNAITAATDGSSDIGTGTAENCRVSSDECTLHY